MPNSKPLHSLLQRQIRKFHKEEWLNDEMIRPFLNAVSDSYHRNDEDRAMLDNAMRLSSDELGEKRLQLRRVIEQQAKVLASLKDAAVTLLPGEQFHEDEDILRIADVLQEEIARRQSAEWERRDTEKRLHEIMDSLQLGLAYFNDAGQLTGVQERFAEIAGRPAQWLLGKTASQLQNFDVNSTAALRFSVAREVYETSIITPKSEEKWLLCITSPMTDRNNQRKGGAIVIFDITDRKKLESELKAARSAAESALEIRKAIIANVSHELRTPVNGIIGMTELLSSTSLDERQKELIQTLRYSSTSLLQLVGDILDVSRLESGKFKLENIPFSLSEMLTALDNNHRHRASKKGIVFVLSVDDRLHTQLLGDPHRLSQILQNLLSNAVKFTAQGQVEFEVKLASDTDKFQEILFVIRDSGIGIASDKLETIFQEFSQEDASTSRKFGGTGLGLSISRKLARLMGSDIRVKSEKGQGSEFSFHIKLEKCDAVAAAEVTEFLPDLSGVSVLVAEDNEVNQFLAKMLLIEWHARVATANDGVEAVEWLKTDSFDIVLMDLQMPNMDGLTAMREIRNVLRLTVPVIALTANAVEGEMENCLAAGMQGYLSKPYNHRVLYEEICRHIQKK
jgi:PAS domain S-box-containing protein